MSSSNYISFMVYKKGEWALSGKGTKEKWEVDKETKEGATMKDGR